MDNYGDLHQQLQEINSKIYMINKGYTSIKTPGEIIYSLKDHMRTLEKLDNLLSLNFRDLRVAMGEENNVLGIPYDILPEDASIDVAISYNSFDAQMMMIPPSNTTLYPLIFPYTGVRGPRGEIEQMITQYLGRAASAFIGAVLGNEPIEIKVANFQPVSLLKPPIGLSGSKTLIGIIDTGIDYTNPAFISENGETRIASIWDQTIGRESPYGYGTIYSKEMINSALSSSNPFELVPHRDEWGHGTILAGIAAGRANYEEGPYVGVAPGAELAIVKLKPASDGMQKLYHGKYNPLGFSALDIALAFEYLVTLANQMKRPISICLPSGTNTGSHDGTNVLDYIISSYSTNPGISTVLAAGEEANKAHHASGDLREENEQTIGLTIPKGQVGFSVEIWAMFGDRIEVTLTPPEREDTISAPILLNTRQTYSLSESSSVWSYGIRFDIDTGCQVIGFRFESPLEGLWTITVKGLVVIEGVYHIWIPKTGMILPGTVLSPENPFTTIYNTSGARGVIIIGCYNKRSLSACGNSGRGFTRDNRVSPDYIVDGISMPGPLPNGGWGLISGTAPSSAITAGIISLIYEDQLLSGEPLANTIVMKAILADKVKRQPTVTYPNPSSGYGVIDINSDLF